MRIDKSVVLVTGGSSGLGAAFVEALLEGGAAHIYAASRHPKASSDDRVTPISMDVRDVESVKTAARSLTDVNLVINSAGSFHGGVSVLNAPTDDLRADLETNVFGVLNVTRAFAPILAANGGGAFLNVHSLLSLMTTGDGYSVSKGATWALSNAIRGAVASSGTQVLGLHVGFMDTEMTKDVVGVEKADPLVIARIGLDALIRNQNEVLADEISRTSKLAVAGDPANLYLG